MLAKFENGYFLEVICDEEENEYQYVVYDFEGDEEDSGYTELRDMSMYYPMGLIDYILEYCEPEEVKGDYKILDQKTMEEYLDWLTEDPNGKWILEAQGTNNVYEKRYSSFEAAQAVMEIQYTKLFEDRDPCMENNCDFSFACIGDEEFYQEWNIYEEEVVNNPAKKVITEIERELCRANIGVTQYAYELMDTDVIRDHISKVEQLIANLKEMI